MESMNIALETVVGMKEEKKKATIVVPDKVVEKKEIVKDVRVRVSDLMGWESVNYSVTELVIAAKCCNEKEVKEVDLCRFVSLKVFEVGYECFKNVEEVKLIGLSQLERVVIGQKCFTKDGFDSDDCDYDPYRHFYLKDCERVRELKMGARSFSDYSVCEIENVDSLEVIEMGNLDKWSYNFFFASLELKNMPSLKSLLFGGSAFWKCSRAVFENLPVLTSIQLGDYAFCFKYDDDSTELIMRNLPKLTTLTSVEHSRTFKYPRSIILEDMPSLTTVTLPHAFEEKYKLSHNNVGELINHPSIPEYNPNANVHSTDEFMSMNSSIEVLIVDCLACNDESCTALDLSSYVSLKVFEVSDGCFKYVEEVKMIGLNQLERVVIGKNSFTKRKNGWPSYDPNRHFYLKNCERLRELKIGCYSFSDYSVCEIENVPSLEVIEMGELNEWSYIFDSAPLELKNLPSLKSLLFGRSVFCNCSRVVFENLPELTTIQLGSSAFQFNGIISTELIMRSECDEMT
ncbi:hypothetical protein BLSTO_04300 [Blastocystis sp. subtype 1]